MKILLIRSDNFNFPHETNITGVYPPLGMAYIAAVLKREGYRVGVLDNQILCLSEAALKNKIRAFAPDVVLLSAMSPLWPGLIRLAELIKEVSSHIVVGVGGSHLTVYPCESLAHRHFDFGIYGEGEQTAVEVVKAIEASKKFDGIKGCIFRKDGEVVVTCARKEIEDLDSIPFPAVELLPLKQYFALSLPRPFFTMVTSRGCPYFCKFCFQGYLGSYRARSAENVVEEMEVLVNKYKIKEIIIFDETFAAEEERVLKICELIRKKRLKFGWDVRTRVDLINFGMLKALRSAGCGRIHLGIESGSQEVLLKMGKNLKIAEIKEKVSLSKKAGFEVRGYFMLAYPGETRKTIEETIDFSKTLALDWASFTVTIGLPGTEIYNQALQDKYFTYDYWKEYTKGNIFDSKPYFLPEGFSEKDLFALKKRAYLEFYLRPRIIWNILRRLNGRNLIKDIPFFLKLLPDVYKSIVKI